ncbi:MAG: Methyltransferase [Firmicutes bacterium]|nr:Methyltransferase [Bacillota bacterium]MDI6705624.1 class I SAM-dependent methyltransferase [Bacillota bacterium]
MSTYKGFAHYYDRLMEDVDYDMWVDYLEKIFDTNDTPITTVLEIACGTGNVSNRLAKRGYTVYAADRSEDMLALAQDKALEMGARVRYLHQDMRDIRLDAPVDCIICVCDGMNYILDDDDMEKVCKGVYNNLNAGGLFAFDMNSHYKISEIIGSNTFGHSGEEISYVWENYYDSGTRICEYYLTFFEKVDANLYRKFEETHRQKAYLTGEMEKLLKKNKLKIIGVYGAFTFESPGEGCERVQYVVKRDSI